MDITLVSAKLIKTTQKFFRWKVTLSYKNKTMTIKYFLGKAHQSIYKDGNWQPAGYRTVEQATQDTYLQSLLKPTMPTLDDVLNALQADAGSIGALPRWKTWSVDMGYNTDSRSGHKIFRKCWKQYRKLQEFLGEEFTQFLSLPLDG